MIRYSIEFRWSGSISATPMWLMMGKYPPDILWPNPSFHISHEYTVIVVSDILVGHAGPLAKACGARVLGDRVRLNDARFLRKSLLSTI